MLVVLNSDVEERSTKATAFYRSLELEMDASGPPDLGTFMTKFYRCLQKENPRIWVFGYGSLMWKPDFQYNAYKIGFVENFERKFNQGNETFRGTEGKPGRVANLEEKEGGKVWGVAFEVCGHEEVRKVLKELHKREVASGNYKDTMTTFRPRKCFKNPNNIDNRMRCCSKSHHNIPLPHPPRGVAQTLPQAPKHDSSEQRQQQHSASCSLSWYASYAESSSCQNNVDEHTPICPCHVHIISSESSSRSTRVPHFGQTNPSRSDESRHRSQNTPDSNLASEKTGKSLRVRKDVIDSFNHTRLHNHTLPHHIHTFHHTHTYSNPPSRDFQNITQESRTSSSNLHVPSKINEHKNNSVTPHKLIDDLDLNFMTSQAESIWDSEDVDDDSPIDVILFTVIKENSLYLGNDDVGEMAAQIIETGGTAGTNVEYVLRIADFIKKYIPEDDDRHLFDLDERIREKLLLHAQREGDLGMVEALQREGYYVANRRVNS